MKKKQSNKLNSYLSVKGVLDKHRKLVSSIPILEQTAAEFFDAVDEIRKVGTRTAMDTTGETSAKLAAKEELARLASGLAASGMAYAFDRADSELEAALDYAYYKIRYARDADTVHIAKAIETVLSGHLDSLGGYMISGEHLADLRTHIDKFRDAMQEKGGVKSERVADTRELARLFKSTDDLLRRKMDRLVLRLKTGQSDFYHAYHSARKIIDL